MDPDYEQLPGRGHYLGLPITLLIILSLAVMALAQDIFGAGLPFTSFSIKEFFNIEIDSKVVQDGFVIVGVGMAALISYVVYLLRIGKDRARIMAEGMVRELTTAREQLRRLYDQGPVPHLILTPKGSILNPNLAALRFFKMIYEELSGRDFFSMVHQEDVETMQSLMARFKQDVPFEGREIRLVRKDGGVRWVLLSIFAVRNVAKRGRQGVVTLVDVTEQKELEEAKTQFVSLASHQLRTPLSTVKWYTSMLTSGDLGELNDKQQQYIQKVIRGNEVMIDLVNTLLDVSRLEVGKLQANIDDVDAVAEAESVWEELAPQIQEKSIRVKKEYDESFRHIRSDKKLMRIVFQNLLSNAVKYTPDNGVVTLKMAGNTIVVSDTGVGIPQDQQEKIFTKMFRADNVRTEIDGNGLGLYLVKKIVDLLGGEISFVSQQDKGTTFTVVLR